MKEQVQIVKCPMCSGPSRYASDNAYRPFCSARCKNLDLGAWANESFRFPDQNGPEADSLNQPND